MPVAPFSAASRALALLGMAAMGGDVADPTQLRRQMMFVLLRCHVLHRLALGFYHTIRIYSRKTNIVATRG